AVYSGLLPGSPLTELKIHGLSLELEQDAERRWRVLGLPAAREPGRADPLAVLEGFGELQIEQASLRVRAPRLGIDAQIPRVDLRLRVGGDRLKAGVRAWPEGGGQPLQAVLDLERGSWDGRMWAGSEDAELADWAPLLAGTGLVPAGRGDIDVWVDVAGQQVRAVQAETQFRQLALAARAPWLEEIDADRSPPTRFDQLQLSAQWKATGHGWQVQVPTLRVRSPGQAGDERYDGLWIAGGERFALEAPRLALAPVRALLPLSEQLPDGLRRWLYRAAPQGVLEDVHVVGERGGAVRGSLRLAGVGWQAAGSTPGLHDLRGTAYFDERGGVLRLREVPMRFDWVLGFGAVLPIGVDGSLVWWRDGGQWTFGTAGLYIQGEDYGARIRGELRPSTTGGKPRLDLAAAVDETNFVAAKRFWVRHKMPPKTVDWLDNALVEGQVRAGRAVIGGDLHDWPFANGLGRFDARAEVRGARVQFSPDWPATESLDVDVAFDGPGMSLSGSGALMGTAITRVAGGITRFREPWLELDIAGQGRAENLQRLLRASPLERSHGEHLAAAQVQGNADLSLRLSLPLKPDLGERRIEGELRLDEARLFDSRWNIAFNDVEGRVDFDQDGFAAEDMQVLFEGEPARFDLSVGAATAQPGVAALARLRGEFPPDALIRQYPPLSWLQPWLGGRSEWTIALRVPQPRARGPMLPSELSVHSDLVGTTVSLPAPLSKPTSEALDLRLDASLPLAGGELRLQLGQLLWLRGRAAEGEEGLAGVIDLGEPGAGPLPLQGLRVRGRAERMDAAGWIAFASRGEGTGGLRSLDVQCSALDVFGSEFADTSVKMVRNDEGARVDLQGPAVAGRIDVPTALDRGITADFARLHWPAKSPATTPEPLPEPEDDADPTRMPAVRAEVADLRMGGFPLGRTVLAAEPVADGLQISRFDSEHPRFSLQAKGVWRRGGEGQRTRSEFAVAYRASALGELLDQFGPADVIRDGPVSGRLDGSWPGSPGAFELANFTGVLQAEVGEGQLLEVEPGGGGRVLGLISLAELPRRLTLDFSDFFEKGFGFNSIRGDFRFDAGRAQTDNLRMDGPAAEILISGTTDMKAQTWDQRVEVLPKTGGVLPALGALTGGPAGAALGAMAQAVLQKPLKQAGRTVYRISGPWAEPVTEVIERGAPPTTPVREAETTPTPTPEASAEPGSEADPEP
ncbi:MAG TPA: YhdP family protein, partial [Arenimonas sp.]|nr:YhdP family protein [Arenimonas sp.]